MKKLTLITIVILFSLIHSTAYADTVLYKGDINIDGNVNASDALMVLKHAAKIEAVDTLIADVDENTAVNATDALWILKLAAKLVTEFPGGNIINIPTQTVSPDPTETASPVPTETISPNPTETITPIPTETNGPTPTETIAPTLTPIESVKEYISKNGFEGDNGDKIYGYTYEEDTVEASITYTSEDTLVFSLNYKEKTDTELMLVAVEMVYDTSIEDISLEVGYEYGDFKQNYKAKAPIIPEEITKDTVYAFSETSSLNCSDAEKEAILSMGSMYTETALYLWNSILSEDMNLSLSDLGFIKYIP